MKLTTRNAVPVLFATMLATVSLAGCSAEAEPDREPSDENPSGVQQPCIVGTWNLDVPDYQFQAEEYLLGLGIPIMDYALNGAGTIEFTGDGLVATDIDLTSTGTIVAGDTRVPLDIRSGYTASGNWSPGEDLDSIDLANWSNVPDPSIPVDPAAPPIPAVDYTDVEAVMAFCTENFLVLEVPGAPLSTRWTR
jgi:hypothetical protein